MNKTIKCQSSTCQNEATSELQLKTDGMTSFRKDDPSKNGKPYILRHTKLCAEHAQEYKKKYLIESEIGL